jgi:hypothetical protein
MTGDVVPLGTGGSAVSPFAGETEVVGALPADVVVAEVEVEDFWISEFSDATEPETFVLLGGFWSGSGGGRVVVEGVGGWIRGEWSDESGHA